MSNDTSDTDHCPVCHAEVAASVKADSCHSVESDGISRVCVDSHGVTATVYLHTDSVDVELTEAERCNVDTDGDRDV